MEPKSPTNPNPGGRERLPGYPQDKNPAGTPDPKPDEFPGKPPSVYAQRDAGAPKKQPDPDRRPGNPDVNQPPHHGDPELDRKSNVDMSERPRKPENPSRQDKAGAADPKTKEQ